MGETRIFPVDDGLDVVDISESEQFRQRAYLEHSNAPETAAMLRLCNVFLENPEGILQELVDVALEVCGADSAGICLEQPEKGDVHYWRWVAVAGQYKHLVGSTLPREPNACGTCLERNTPQHLRIRQVFFDRLGIDAKPVTDGLLLPWQTDGARGTVWVVAHGRTEAFGPGDLTTMLSLTEFAALAWQTRLLEGDEDDLDPEHTIKMSQKLSKLVLKQRSLLGTMLHAAGEHRITDEQRVAEEEKERLQEMEQRLQEWDGDGSVH